MLLKTTSSGSSPGSGFQIVASDDSEDCKSKLAWIKYSIDHQKLIISEHTLDLAPSGTRIFALSGDMMVLVAVQGRRQAADARPARAESARANIYMFCWLGMKRGYSSTTSASITPDRPRNVEV